MSAIAINEREFARFQRFILDIAGITMSDAKKALVSGRLAKRLHHFGLDSYDAYFELLADGQHPDEAQVAVDLLTTNETYFFREARHFDLLREAAAAHGSAGTTPFRVWSAACSSGEEPYSIAMVLADVLGNAPWEVVASDISTRVLQRARIGHYPMERATHVPPDYLKRFCLKGIREQQGTLLVDRALRQRVQFRQVNLNTQLPDQLGMFDVIFLRNVMIYFNADTKRQVVARVTSRLKPGGHFFIGHSESLQDISSAVQPVIPSVYRKAAAVQPRDRQAA
ncbi:CheR family methyltransferase [Pseudoduganella umbonata]|uniref:Chemotaxis protein methyltransferase n=1 Tax=Pseudoduganella umbonata TaxID=864828 RepID=A0A4P8HNU3_9BURK|nr:protein-glutamate O-methyltransferase CheR [Pseudoduganella umbonata]MBB3224250.1 chemotaxis protein methyltransferase CheR [Pseudoduganella umbonata]QCP11367.1 protein-glutamate O-methyltransferase CheR [Pseudoduganella umbonata]